MSSLAREVEFFNRKKYVVALLIFLDNFGINLGTVNFIGDANELDAGMTGPFIIKILEPIPAFFKFHAVTVAIEQEFVSRWIDTNNRNRRAIGTRGIAGTPFALGGVAQDIDVHDRRANLGRTETISQKHRNVSGHPVEPHMRQTGRELPPLDFISTVLRPEYRPARE